LFLLLSLCFHAAVANAAESEELYFLAGNMPIGRKKLGSAVVGNHLYAISGEEDKSGYVASVLKAPIAPDGTLGEWTPTPPLPANRSYIGNCTLSRQGIIYVAGGNIHRESGPGPGISGPDVLMARVQDDGELTEWVASEPFPGPPVQGNAAVATTANLYVLGGADDKNVAQSIVYRSPFWAGGSLGSWTVEQPLPVPVWFHAAACVGNRIVVWGGVTGDRERIAKTWASAIQPDGSLGPWTEELPLPHGLTHAQAVSVPPFLVSLAGVKADRTANPAIYFNMLSPSGLSGWQRVQVRFPIASYASGCHDPQRGLIYIVGGTSGEKLTGGKTSPGVYGFRVLSGGNTTHLPRPTPSPASERPKVEPPAPPPGTPDVTWFLNDIVEAHQESRRVSKPLLVLFGSASSPSSQRLWDEVCMHPSFKLVGQKYVCSSIDADAHQALTMRMGIFRIPAVVLLDERGDVIKAESGDNLDISSMLDF